MPTYQPCADGSRCKHPSPLQALAESQQQRCSRTPVRTSLRLASHELRWKQPWRVAGRRRRRQEQAEQDEANCLFPTLFPDLGPAGEAPAAPAPAAAAAALPAAAAAAVTNTTGRRVRPSSNSTTTGRRRRGRHSEAAPAAANRGAAACSPLSARYYETKGAECLTSHHSVKRPVLCINCGRSTSLALVVGSRQGLSLLLSAAG
jgi:hypothetical protein